MNKTSLWAFLAIVTGLLLGSYGIYIYSQNTRYYLQITQNGVAYKIDRKTGQTWRIIPGQEEELVGGKPITPEQSPSERTITLTRSLYNSYIHEWMQEEKGYLKIIGWKAKKIDAQTYLVSYTFYKGAGEQGYFYEVNLTEDIVRPILNDPDLAKRYEIVTLPPIEGLEPESPPVKDSSLLFDKEGPHRVSQSNLSGQPKAGRRRGKTRGKGEKIPEGPQPRTPRLSPFGAGHAGQGGVGGAEVAVWL